MNKKGNWNRLRVILFLVLASVSCQREEGVGFAERIVPAKIETKTVGEATLTTLTLTPDAVERLGIALVEAHVAPVRQQYEVAGEIVLPPGQVVTVLASLAGAVSFPSGNPAAGSQIEAGSQRTIEDTAEAVKLAETELAAA